LQYYQAAMNAWGYISYLSDTGFNMFCKSYNTKDCWTTSSSEIKKFDPYQFGIFTTLFTLRRLVRHIKCDCKPVNRSNDGVHRVRG